MDDIMKLSLHDYENVQELSDAELIKLISEIIDIEEILPALSELHMRDAAQSLLLGKKILETNAGDEYLQAGVIEFIFEHDKQYVVDFATEYIMTLNWYVYASILDCLCVESEQSFGEKLSRHFIETILNRYDQYEEKEKDKIKENYTWFLSAYSEMIDAE